MTPVQCIEYALTRPGRGFRDGRMQDAGRNPGPHSTGAAHRPAERDYASAMAGMERFTWEGHCMYCGHCAPCSAGIDIATVHKFHNLAVAQGEIPKPCVNITPRSRTTHRSASGAAHAKRAARSAWRS